MTGPAEPQKEIQRAPARQGILPLPVSGNQTHLIQNKKAISLNGAIATAMVAVAIKNRLHQNANLIPADRIQTTAQKETSIVKVRANVKVSEQEKMRPIQAGLPVTTDPKGKVIIVATANQQAKKDLIPPANHLRGMVIRNLKTGQKEAIAAIHPVTVNQPAKENHIQNANHLPL